MFDKNKWFDIVYVKQYYESVYMCDVFDKRWHATHVRFVSEHGNQDCICRNTVFNLVHLESFFL